MPRRVGPIADLDAWRAAALEQIDGRTVVCSISGGKDSTAMALLLKEAEIPFVSVHLDTSWEHPLTEEYVRDYLPTVIGPIQVALSGHQGGVDVDLAHVVDDDGYTAAFAVGQDVVEQGRLAGAQESGEHSDGQFRGHFGSHILMIIIFI